MPLLFERRVRVWFHQNRPHQCDTFYPMPIFDSFPNAVLWMPLMSPDRRPNKLKHSFKATFFKLMTKEMKWRYQERRLRETYEPLIAKAKGDERESLHQELSAEMWEIFRERQQHNDLRLIGEARRYSLPIPPRRDEDGFWEEWGPGNWVLTEKGSYHLLKEIRSEQKERLALRKARIDVAIGWVPLITGLIGALIGLFSVFSK